MLPWGALNAGTVMGEGCVIDACHGDSHSLLCMLLPLVAWCACVDVTYSVGECDVLERSFCV